MEKCAKLYRNNAKTTTVRQSPQDLGIIQQCPTVDIRCPDSAITDTVAFHNEIYCTNSTLRAARLNSTRYRNRHFLSRRCQPTKIDTRKCDAKIEKKQLRI